MSNAQDWAALMQQRGWIVDPEPVRTARPLISGQHRLMPDAYARTQVRRRRIILMATRKYRARKGRRR